jgi:hypothetical protein
MLTPETCPISSAYDLIAVTFRSVDMSEPEGLSSRPKSPLPSQSPLWLRDIDDDANAVDETLYGVGSGTPGVDR